ncbi:endonuclease/exonuclease/phosphatase family protein [Marinitenerispora sediminis]|uniref:Endonuclease n=1 Tax=Marinitenerispora sediminis TaxID=1931232 RepID=A0A368SY01_9ACTN|nr:endonuclease/exonuclease/phosphatase family protein [Marinitenerispora sediminis]RCV47646.1 endonuclease [Marinitenerispora sediminis]RCV47650.1 endonuclease [Marinitenerispora sediminis]RCV48497.1 endonuclease [Marinitenerispora sediminis]
MRSPARSFRLGAALAAGALALTASPALAGTADPAGTAAHASRDTVRFATFNASLNRSTEGQLAADLATGGNAQARTVAEIIQRSRPDVLLVNEFDHDPDGTAAALFQRNYLSVGQGGAAPIEYPYRYTAPSNTGVPSGFDLNNDGRTVTEPGQPGYGDDALGFGEFPGQYGMVVFSRYPIDESAVRTFRDFRWADMPGALLPTDPATGEPFYDEDERAVLRLSSKSHWDLPVRIGRTTVHLLVSHPTPPSFDGPEQRNVRRNHDEIRFWSDYVRPGAGGYIYDDEGGRGGLRPGERFVIAGDLNSDPRDGNGEPGAIGQLLDHPRVNAAAPPSSEGAAEAAASQGGANTSHLGDPAQDTADFADEPGPGNLRVDYVLPSRQLRTAGGGVFWPASADPLSRLTGEYPFPSSDHRLVWLDVRAR